MIFFEDEADITAYQKWREDNPNGYVLNINTLNPESNRYKNLVHIAAGCQSLNAPPAANQDRPVTKSHPKYCSNDINEVLKKMSEMGLIKTVHACYHCRLKFGQLFDASLFNR